MKNTEKSKALYRRALQVMVGGVNSPVRSFKYVGGEPLFIREGKGSIIKDADGNSYVDYVLSYGALIHGHADRRIIKAVISAASKGTAYGAPTEKELILAEKICNAFPSIEKIRLVNSGTEATLSALRLAKAYTKRKIIVKFDGCYHGHVDQLLVRAGSGYATFGIPSSEGVDEEYVSRTISAKYNDIDQIEKIFKLHPKDIAAVIVEPVSGNMGVVPGEMEFLKSLRELCDNYGSLLIFDEVITGFRISRGGAQELYKITADITCLGKIIGGGFPLAAFGGRGEIMKLLAPEGPVYQAGTMSGNPVACAAGLEAISNLNQKEYTYLEAISSELERGILQKAKDSGLPVSVNRVGSMLSLFFTSRRVRNFDDVLASDKQKFIQFHSLLLEQGIYIPPSPYESLFLSTSHSKEDIKITLRAISRAFELMK
jgi:glutamate-1-semialdehyde 2,1-aminomutase